MRRASWATGRTDKRSVYTNASGSATRSTMPSSSRAVCTGGVAFFACIAVGLLAGVSACGGHTRPIGTPMSGSAAILPSPVKAERVPIGDEGSAKPAPSAGYLPALAATAPQVTPPPASASVSPKKP